MPSSTSAKHPWGKAMSGKEIRAQEGKRGQAVEVNKWENDKRLLIYEASYYAQIIFEPEGALAQDSFHESFHKQRFTNLMHVIIKTFGVREESWRLVDACLLAIVPPGRAPDVNLTYKAFNAGTKFPVLELAQASAGAGKLKTRDVNGMAYVTKSGFAAWADREGLPLFWDDPRMRNLLLRSIVPKKLADDKDRSFRDAALATMLIWRKDCTTSDGIYMATKVASAMVKHKTWPDDSRFPRPTVPAVERDSKPVRLISEMLQTYKQELRPTTAANGNGNREHVEKF